jgi:hypothetical protein
VSTKQFDEEVFPRELEEVSARRKQLGLTDTEIEADNPLDANLVGLALSGGGIRSSTISLGAIQALAKGKVLPHVDYLSTVSGGGFVGGCLSSTLNSPHAEPSGESFPLKENVAEEESLEITQLRNSGKYLAPIGFLEKLRIPALLIRGMIINLVLLFPAISLAVFMTELWAESSSESDDLLRLILRTSAGLFLILAVIPPYLSYLFVRHFTWRSRQKYEYLFIFFLVISVACLVMFPVTMIIELAIDMTWGRFVYETLDDLSLAGDSSFFWLVAAVSVTALMMAGKASQNLAKARNRVFLYLVSAIGPVLIFLIYALLCVWQIDSPYVHLDARYILKTHQIDDLRTGELPPKLRIEMNRENQPIDRNNQGVTVEAVTDQEGAWTITDADNHRYSLSLRDRTLTVKNKWLLPQLRQYKVTPQIKKLLDSRDILTTIGQLLCTEKVEIAGTMQCPVEKVEAWEIVDQDSGEIYRFSLATDERLLLDPRPVDLWDSGDWYFVGGSLLVFLLNLIFVNVNFTSLHGFYRDQLTRGFLFEETPDGNYEAGKLVKLSSLNKKGTTAPYQLLNVTLNLQGSDDESLRGRGADFFLFSKHFVGCERTGFVPTPIMEAVDSHLDLGTAMAISGAAASPNAGAVAIKPLVFVLTMLNLRLDYWLPNPKSVVKGGRLRNFILQRGAGPMYVVREAVGALNANRSFVNLSDGGHLENTGIYPLLERRCRTIICIDGEEDQDLSFDGLVKLIRFASIDLGIDIDIDLSGFKRQEDGFSRQHFTVGKINYGSGETGQLFYVKASMTGDENPYVSAYQAKESDFPHESTAQQFFSEEQFEAYRALGSHMATELVNQHPTLAAADSTG